MVNTFSKEKEYDLWQESFIIDFYLQQLLKWFFLHVILECVLKKHDFFVWAGSTVYICLISEL